MIIIYAKEIKKKIDLSIEESVILIAKIKDELKIKDVVVQICNEYGFLTDIIDGVIIRFDEIETSAETVNGEIVLNKDLIKEEFDVLMRYPVHELVHVFQHMEREGASRDPYEGMDYLDRPDEKEAFKAQIKDEKETRGEGAAEQYVDELLDYHSIPKTNRTKKKNELLGKA